MIETSQRIPAVLLDVGQVAVVSVECYDHTIVASGPDGTEKRRLPLDDAEIISARRDTLLHVGSSRFRFDPQHDAAVRAMFAGVVTKTRKTAAGQPTSAPAAQRRFALGFLSVAKLATIVFAILGVVGGLIVAGTTVENDSGFFDYEEHPYVGWGLAGVVATLASAVVVGAVLTALAHLIEHAGKPSRA